MNYEALRAVLRRANEALGTNYSMHDCRHTAAIRMTQSRKLSVRDVQAILGHAHLTTTQVYLVAPSGIASGGRVSAGCQVGDRGYVTELAV
jgi:integrase